MNYHTITNRGLLMLLQDLKTGQFRFVCAHGHANCGCTLIYDEKAACGEAVRGEIVRRAANRRNQ